MLTSLLSQLLCGAHALKRVEEIKSHKIQRGGFCDSLDIKGVLVKSMAQGWGFSSKRNLRYHTRFLQFAKGFSNATFMPNITKCAYLGLWHFIMQYFISLH